MPNPLLQNENQELLVVEAMKEYSAGSGIDITSSVISLDPYISASIDSKLASADFGTYSAGVAQDIAYVSANAGKTYYAGDNIGISDDYVISSKDWTNDISNASAYAYNQAVAQIPAPQDLSYMSGAIDINSSDIQYISGVAITAHQDWTDTITAASSYAYNQATAQIPPQFDPTYMSGAIDKNVSDIQYISGVVITAHQDLSDYYTTANANTLSSMLSGAIDYVSGQVPAPVDLSYISGGVDYVSGVVGDKLDATAFNIPASSTWNDVSTNVQSNSSIWNDTTNVVQTNSSTWNNPGTSLTGDAQGAVDYVYTNSGDIMYSTGMTAYIPYSAVGVELVNSNFKIDPSGQAYKNETQIVPGATITGTYRSDGYYSTEFNWNDLQPNVDYVVYFDNAPQNAQSIEVYYWDGDLFKEITVTTVYKDGNKATFSLPSDLFVDTSNKWIYITYANEHGYRVQPNAEIILHQNTIVGGYVPYLTQTSANATYQPIGNYVLENDLEQVSGNLKNDIDYISGVAITAHQSLDNYYTKSETSGADELSNAFANIPAGDADVNAYVQGNSATIDNVNSTVQTNSAQWAQGGGSVDTIPVAVISPLVTGFSGESAYLGIESTALNLSSYVPVSSIGYNGSYISTISGKSISSYTGRYAMTANYANTADRAYKDRNSNEITSYYQPKLTIAGENGTITAINNSAVGASIPEGWELVAGNGISIVDDSENNQTIIRATGGGGGDVEVNDYVYNNSATINEVNTTVQSNSSTWGQGGGTSLTGDAQGAVDTIYSNSGHYLVNNAFGQTITNAGASIQLGSNSTNVPYISLNGDKGYLGPGSLSLYTQNIVVGYTASINTNTNGRIAGLLQKQKDSTSSLLDTTALSFYNGNNSAYLDLTDINNLKSSSGGSFPTSADEAVQYVESNSGTIDDTITNVSTNSGSWGGQSLPISAGSGVNITLVDNTLVFSNDYNKVVIDEIITAGYYRDGNSIYPILQKTVNIPFTATTAYNTNNVILNGSTTPWSGASIKWLDVGNSFMDYGGQVRLATNYQLDANRIGNVVLLSNGSLSYRGKDNVSAPITGTFTVKWVEQ